MAWDLMQLVPNLMKAYTNVIPITIFAGILIGILSLGMWRRNRSVRLVMITFIILGGVLFSSSSMGLGFGVPGAEQQIGMVLVALGFAGVALSFVKR